MLVTHQGGSSGVRLKGYSYLWAVLCKVTSLTLGWFIDAGHTFGHSFSSLGVNARFVPGIRAITMLRTRVYIIHAEDEKVSSTCFDCSVWLVTLS